MNYGFNVKTDMPVNLIDWAKGQRERIDRENELLQKQLYGGLENAAKAGVFAKQYMQQEDDYAAAMNEIYNSPEEKRAELLKKYSINPEDFAEYANVQDKYRSQVNQRKEFDKWALTPKKNVVNPMSDKDMEIYRAYGYFA